VYASKLQLHSLTNMCVKRGMGPYCARNVLNLLANYMLLTQLESVPRGSNTDTYERTRGGVCSAIIVCTCYL